MQEGYCTNLQGLGETEPVASNSRPASTEANAPTTRPRVGPHSAVDAAADLQFANCPTELSSV